MRERRVQDLIYDLRDAFSVICLNVDKIAYIIMCTEISFTLFGSGILVQECEYRLVLRRF